ncbi:MAG: hypothetical protein LBM70_01405 [Victivallales bacterium]|jgi:hypothetical protein|nr:hypothetical protein [Victivallales bacterium]
MKNNTIVTVGDLNYFWGVFLLVASLRKNGMDEPVIVYGSGYGKREEKLLAQFGDVKTVSAGEPGRSLTCSKPEAMLLAETEFVTWVDSDGFFVGNCSKRLAPESSEEIHIRMRSPAENVLVYQNKNFSGDGQTIPAEVLAAWQADVPNAGEARLTRCCSACYMSLPRSHRDFLEAWRDQMAKVLPQGNVGVVDHRVKFYHQLDESVLNSLLCFLPNAPRVSAEYRLDKDPDELFIHFVCHPKPWVGWAPMSFRHFDRYIDVVDYVVKSGMELPGELLFSLRRKNRLMCRLLCEPMQLRHKLRRMWQKIKNRAFKGGR